MAEQVIAQGKGVTVSVDRPSAKTYLFDVDGARKDGIPDAEIASFLGRQLGYDVEAMRKDGHPDSDIIATLKDHPVPEGGFLQKNMTPAQVAAEKDAVARVSAAPGAERAFGQGVTAGWGDELDAGLASATTGVNNAIRRMTGQPDVGYGMSDAYHAVRDATANADAQFRQQHPYIAAGSELAGSVLSPAAKLGGGFVGRGASAVGRMTRAAGVGAGYGAVAGAGAADGDLIDRAKGAGIGAMTGAAAGAALSGGADLVGTGYQGINAATGYRFTSPENAAAARLRQVLNADGVTADKIDAAVAQAERVGATPRTLLDVGGQNTKRLLRYAGSREGEASNLAQDYRDTTAEALAGRNIDRARQLTPDEPRPASVVAADLEKARSSAAQTDYAEPYAQFVEVPDGIKEMLQDPAGRSIIQAARANAIENQDWGGQVELDKLLRPTENGQLPQISASTLDRLAIAARERGGRFAEAGQNYRARGAFGRQGQINDLLDSTPGLEEARGSYRSHSQAIDAVTDLGPTILKATPDEFAATVGQLDDRGLSAARVGARQAITDALGKGANAYPTLKTIAFAPNAQRNLIALFGEEEGGKLIQAAKLNLRQAERANYAAPDTGPQTFNRTDDARGFGSVLNIVREPVQAIMEKVASGLTITDTEAAQLVRTGQMTAQEALAATKPRMVSRIGSAIAGRMTVGASEPAAGIMTRQVMPPQPTRPAQP